MAYSVSRLRRSAGKGVVTVVALEVRAGRAQVPPENDALLDIRRWHCRRNFGRQSL